MAALSQLQEDAGAIDVPLSYTDDLYRLRSHIEFVEHLLKRLDGAPDPESDKEDGKQVLILKSGGRAAVSRTYAGAVKAAGLS